MKGKKWVILAAIGIFLLFLGIFLLFLYETIKFQYNRLVSLDQRVKESWSQVENVLQRRNDLIPNLVVTVKGYAKHERELFTEVTRMRSQLLQAKTVSEKADASDALSSVLGRLLVVVENYPQLKASENFLHLQDELAGTENRIAVERKRYNETVREYNRIVKSIPIVFFMRRLPFDHEKPYFEATPESRQVPKVSF
ncbi:MAG: LemA family protein [bacterium (Candidatus Ratteibacteria) CG23_combo_of_CG06-09_8_20_14_all_48_7]|uniref:LemA family protein n=1 Tax=bacterium (Candidatus Ratteibacteria) CG23_combo_of_CG06-09_8_20_14_all_48_7 TaxID=2014292 RepID=A0A2G9Y819_9BACT|nr:MAG: LemA family protein [bacterium (Candidatus Ratteibacteria) CG23_combo_of_CG06-09_8_20_14_all_48_7]